MQPRFLSSIKTGDILHLKAHKTGSTMNFLLALEVGVPDRCDLATWILDVKVLGEDKEPYWVPFYEAEFESGAIEIIPGRVSNDKP
ncbi:MAG: hypothetical protein ACW96N_05675 [Candidatus Thorarchaeota archaeon]|jgi:hypothetical protein